MGGGNCGWTGNEDPLRPHRKRSFRFGNIGSEVPSPPSFSYLSLLFPVVSTPSPMLPTTYLMRGHHASRPHILQDTGFRLGGSGCDLSGRRLPHRKAGRPAAGHTQELPALQQVPGPAAATLQTQINRMGQPKRKEACREGHSSRQRQGHRVEGGRKSCLGC